MSADERERLLAEDREKTRRDNAACYETGLVDGRAKERRSLIAGMRGQGLSPEQLSTFIGVALDEVNALLSKN